MALFYGNPLIPVLKDQFCGALKCFNEQVVEPTIELPVIWDVIMLIHPSGPFY